MLQHDSRVYVTGNTGTYEKPFSNALKPQEQIAKSLDSERCGGMSETQTRNNTDLSNNFSPPLSSTFSEVSISDKQTFDHQSQNLPSEQVELTTYPSHERRPCNNVAIQQTRPGDLAELLHDARSNAITILDFRTLAQFQSSRLKNAINISIPTTLLKRNSYTVSKIFDSVNSLQAREAVRNWQTCDTVILYDQESFNVGPGSSIYQVALKFFHHNHSPRIHVVKGGFMAIMRDTPSLMQISTITIHDQVTALPQDASSGVQKLAALGNLRCDLPAGNASVNPFFNNIRQNQDLIGGVGEPISLRIPFFPESAITRFPRWLRDLLASTDSAKLVADKFLKIELEEQTRMQRVLSNGQHLSKNAEEERYSIAAGVERGDKNRYNNIWPYENSRVRLQDLSSSDSDYINANYLHFGESGKTYIATQGPLPTTTRDFWQTAWENDVHTIVMLTKTSEGGQAKCHTYWEDLSRMPPYHLELTEEVQIQGHYSVADSTPLTIRKFLLRDTRRLHDSARAITQIQFLDWPDLHVIDPESILALIRQVRIAEAVMEPPAYKRRKSIGSLLPARQSRPILSHCSAGCGRTGTFCTIDTVIDIVRGQLEGEVDKLEEHLNDPIEAVVKSFREQRLSIVQT